MKINRVRIVNITNGRLELKPYRRVLGPSESTVVDEPVADSVLFMLGEKQVRLEKILQSENAPIQNVSPLFSEKTSPEKTPRKSKQAENRPELTGG